MRIVSLLPAATEILYAIGAGDSVVGVTHECDYPPEAKSKPALIHPRLDPAAPQSEIDRQVRELVARGESLYAVDAEQLISLAPDLIVTQDLCHVCAASPEDLASALARMPPERSPRVLSFTPHTIADVCEGIRQMGEAAGREREGRALAEQLAQSAAAVESVAAIDNATTATATTATFTSGESAAAVQRGTSGAKRRLGVLCLEWFDPPYVAGHWVPEMVRLAGGRDLFGREGEHSFQISWQQILGARPEVIVLMPCGYDLEGTLKSWSTTQQPQGWDDLPAVKSGRVYAVDANAYLSRPGPRLAEGLRLLAHFLHPESGAPPVEAKYVTLKARVAGA